MNNTSKNPYKRLRGQMLSVLLLFGLIPLALMGIAGVIANREAIETRMRNVLEGMVKNRQATVELFLAEKMRQLEFTASTNSIDRLSNHEVLELLLERMQQDHGAIVDLGLFNDRGQHIAYVGPYKLENLNYLQEFWFTRVMVLGRYESDIFLGMRHFPHMVMAVKKREGGKDWIVRATIDTDALSELLREGGLESGADVFILNRAGEYQTSYSDAHQLMEKADIDSIPLHSGVRVLETNRNGRREFMATAWLRGDSWILVARQHAPGLSTLLAGHPAVMSVLIIGIILIPLLSYGIARHRLSQFRSLEDERATLYESVAQSQKMAAIGRLAASVAHEINNPLAIIEAQAGVLSDMVEEHPEFPSSAEIRNRIDKIHAQVERGRKVTHRLLGFSRRVGPELEPVDVVAALEETIGFVEKDLEVSRVHVIRKYGSDIPIIRSSLAQMQQVFLNLINNALDAISDGGELRLSVDRSHDGVIVKVGDTGPGIAEKDLKRIFEPFFSTKSGATQNTGLGLAICQEIMRNLNGRIDINSTIGTGTEFSLWFPLEVQA